jgi:hypothetical protein
VNEIVGSGYKKMKGYICPISKADLEKKRIEFWSNFLVIKLLVLKETILSGQFSKLVARLLNQKI